MSAVVELSRVEEQIAAWRRDRDALERGIFLNGLTTEAARERLRLGDRHGPLLTQLRETSYKVAMLLVQGDALALAVCSFSPRVAIRLERTGWSIATDLGFETLPKTVSITHGARLLEDALRAALREQLSHMSIDKIAHAPPLDAAPAGTPMRWTGSLWSPA